MVKIGIIQFRRSRDLEANLEHAYEILHSIDNVDIVCFPEAWVSRNTISVKVLEEKILPRILEESTGKVIITGGLFIDCNGRIYDLCHVALNGKIIGYAGKHFPSRAVGERDYVTSYTDIQVFTAGNICFGVLICVDAMYPELSRILAIKGASIIFNPSSIPYNRISLWRSLGCTRAAENTVFYVFVNNTGTTYPDGRLVNGHSYIASPEGEIVYELNEDEAIGIYNVNIEVIERIRGRWAYFEDASRLWKDVMLEMVLSRLAKL
ncbi:MAG: carbon-nitrogen hydrolase family protein [Candidatus Methanomethylicia archaeon]